MGSCCSANRVEAAAATVCPECDRPGRSVERITLKALLRPAALERLEAVRHHFCPTPSCGVVYFGEGSVFDQGHLTVGVFQKEAAGERTVCYCFAVTEADLRRENAEEGGPTSPARIAALVKADRCACELKNPQGSCCLGNVAAAVNALTAETVTTG